jgi:hypothetical protein
MRSLVQIFLLSLLKKERFPFQFFLFETKKVSYRKVSIEPILLLSATTSHRVGTRDMAGELQYIYIYIYIYIQGCRGETHPREQAIFFKVSIQCIYTHTHTHTHTHAFCVCVCVCVLCVRVLIYIYMYII